MLQYLHFTLLPIYTHVQILGHILKMGIYIRSIFGKITLISLLFLICKAPNFGVGDKETRLSIAS